MTAALPERLVLVAHGSRSGDGRAEMAELGRRVAAAAPTCEVSTGFLELCDPPADEVLEAAAAGGPDRVVVVPLMLHAAGHAKSDVPAAVLATRARHPGVEIVYGRPLGVDTALLEVAARRLEAAGAAGLPLAVMSRGTSDPDANAHAYRVARLVADRSGARAVAAGFSGLTWPTVPEALGQLAALGARRVAAFAWFLATGVLVERLREQYDAFGRAHGIEVVDAGYLGVAAEVVELVLERAAEAAGAPVPPNCDVCIHRRPWPGLEERADAPVGVGHSHLAATHLHVGHTH